MAEPSVITVLVDDVSDRALAVVTDCEHPVLRLLNASKHNQSHWFAKDANHLMQPRVAISRWCIRKSAQRLLENSALHQRAGTENPRWQVHVKDAYTDGTR